MYLSVCVEKVYDSRDQVLVLYIYIDPPRNRGTAFIIHLPSPRRNQNAIQKGLGFDDE